MNKRMIVGYDGSTAAFAAVKWAAIEAELRQVVLEVVACHSLPIRTGWWQTIAEVSDDVGVLQAIAENDVRDMIGKIRHAHPGVLFETTVVLASPLDVLAERAVDADLLVVGTTGASVAKSWLLGSVAQAVARTSPCPVVLVPAGEPAPPIDRIVVGIDGSDSSDAAVDWATDEADRRDVELVVVHAFQYAYWGTDPGSKQARDLTKVDAALVLEAAVARSRDRGRGPVSSELIELPPAAALLDSAVGADLIVVGSRGRGGFRSLLFGSVAHAVSENSSCPTVVVRCAGGAR